MVMIVVANLFTAILQFYGARFPPNWASQSPIKLHLAYACVLEDLKFKNIGMVDGCWRLSKIRSTLYDLCALGNAELQ